MKKQPDFLPVKIPYRAHSSLNTASTVQFNLNLTEHACSKGMTRLIFHFARMQAFVAHKVDDIKPIVQSSCVCTRCVHNVCVHVRNAHAKFGLHVQAICKPRTAE